MEKIQANKKQRSAINRVIRFMRDSEKNGVTSIRIRHVRKFDGSNTLSIAMETRRSDCDQYSIRAIVCNNAIHVFVGPRGKIKVCNWNSGLSSQEHNEEMRKHACRMLGAGYEKY